MNGWIGWRNLRIRMTEVLFLNEWVILFQAHYIGIHQSR